MKSMTGYGYAEYECDDFLMTMELKSYNNRFLEISYFAPPSLSAYEQEITDIIKQYAQRGHIDIGIKIKNKKCNNEIYVDEFAADAYAKAAVKILEICRNNNLDVHAELGDIMKGEGVLSALNSDGVGKYRMALDNCSSKVMEQFVLAKEREGLVTHDDLKTKIQSIEKSLKVVRKNAGQLEKIIKENLTNRINEMLGNQEYDENRILTEIAVMLVRYTVNEEIVRLSAHIEEFKRLLESKEAVGKRMDFLCQEMNREINTIGSKSQIVEMNFEVVNMKDCLENIREQIRNIE